MKSAAELMQSFDDITRDLLAQTAASRVTIRLDDPSRKFHIDGVVSEALAPGVRSLKGETSLDQRAAATAQWIESQRRVLVQNDFTSPDPAPPRELMNVYGVKAQMLGPVIRDGRMTGWISVHDTTGARDWRDEDVAALQAAMARVELETA